MSEYSLDTDIITELLKKHAGNQPIVDRFREELRRNSLFVICPVVFYEIRRELVFKGAVGQRAAFEKPVEAMTWKEFSACGDRHRVRPALSGCRRAGARLEPLGRSRSAGLRPSS